MFRLDLRCVRLCGQVRTLCCGHSGFHLTFIHFLIQNTHLSFVTFALKQWSCVLSIPRICRSSHLHLRKQLLDCSRQIQKRSINSCYLSSEFKLHKINVTCVKRNRKMQNKNSPHTQTTFMEFSKKAGILKTCLARWRKKSGEKKYGFHICACRLRKSALIELKLACECIVFMTEIVNLVI
jgi:hypothetical protein